jgi:hypothetical protein
MAFTREAQAFDFDCIGLISSTPWSSYYTYTLDCRTGEGLERLAIVQLARGIALHVSMVYEHP